METSRVSLQGMSLHPPSPVPLGSRLLNFPDPKDQASFNQFGFQALLGPVTMVKVWNMLIDQDRVTCASQEPQKWGSAPSELQEWEWPISVLSPFVGPLTNSS